MFPTASSIIPAATAATPSTSSTSSLRSPLSSPKLNDPNKELQLKSLNKLVGSCLKSLKYIEQLVSKGKYEILATAVTHLIESLLDVYNLVKTFKLNLNTTNTKTHHHHRHRDMFHTVNVALAKLVKWCDDEQKYNDIQTANELNRKLMESLLKLVESLKEYYFSNNGKNWCFLKMRQISL